jgi:undecaprenyl-diphosphatase
VVGALTIRSFVTIVSRYGLRGFGYYRIVVGAFVLLLLAFGSQIQLV